MQTMAKKIQRLALVAAILAALVFSVNWEPAKAQSVTQESCTAQLVAVIPAAAAAGMTAHSEFNGTTCIINVIPTTTPVVAASGDAAPATGNPALPGNTANDPNYSPSAGLSRPGTDGPVGTVGGYTDCKKMEEHLTGDGTPNSPLVYPTDWLHDTCAAWSGGGTGAKFITISGPTALQMGEATGPARMVYVPSGTTFTGWTQGGWRYTTDTALLAQWMPEAPPQLWGLICGYGRNLKMAVPAFTWDGKAEIRSEDLDCPADVVNMWRHPESVATADTSGAGPAVESDDTLVVGEDWSVYPSIFKIELAGAFYCGALSETARIPAEARIIEEWPKAETDGQYLHQTGEHGMSAIDGFCKGQPVDEAGKPVTSQEGWITVLIQSDGFKPVTFPLE